MINRGHTWEDTADAVRRTAAKGIPCGLHLILGLPGEDEQIMLDTIRKVNELPIDTVKMHQLQLIRGTKMAHQAEAGEVVIKQFTVDEYIDLCVKVVALVRKGIYIERFVSQSPAEFLISPRWGQKNYEFTNKLNNKLREKNIDQGSEY